MASGNATHLTSLINHISMNLILKEYYFYIKTIFNTIMILFKTDNLR